eukprot:TRINITY_DN6248_c0_g1_i4.p1 TRINITY_DN6248_c0_g1~~TRINITY_DN6248_c0_g1_i4.p1  ORF type:complete len:200 (+),score=20.55 TRINITY_DN6248_c0_g1_i4:125-724(+)
MSLKSLSALTLERIRKQLSSVPRYRIKRTAASPTPARASILLPLCHHLHVPSVFLTKRTDHLRNHKGQVSFPGGKIDPTDPNEISTALRELFEETSIPAEQVEVLGILPDAIARGSSETVVTPVVGYIKTDLSQLHIIPNPEEVAACFTVSLADLNDLTKRDVYRGTPRFLNPNPDYHIWGFSGYVLDRFLDSVKHIDE